MTPFLQSIARAYIINERPRLIDSCFIFPNRRSALYFTDYLQTEAHAAGIRIVMPETTTIADFTESFSHDSIPADRMEMVFILFGVYRNVVGAAGGAEAAASIDFNKFIQWADVLLNDFDDVDHALADPEMLFTNVENLKEITANYLTPEQIETLGHYFDTERLHADVEQFWNHIPHDDGSQSHSRVSHSFLRIWQVMAEVYRRFRAELEQRGIHSPGMSVRRAVAAIKAMGTEDFRWQRYVFVGFDYLTNAQIAIMQRMHKLSHTDGSPLADFYWDLSSPAFSGVRAAEGVRTVQRYAEMFPSLYSCIEPVKEFPPINIIGVPSRVGQAKAIGTLLDRIYPTSDATESEALRSTAIVLPEETLLSPLLSSLPDKIADLNVTMGYKLRNTAVAGVIRDIAVLQRHASRGKEEPTFYYEDVIRMLSNPVVRSFNPDLCIQAIMEIQRRHILSVPLSFFATENRRPLQTVFTYIDTLTTPQAVFSYLHSIVDWLSRIVESSCCEHGAADNETGDSTIDSLEADKLPTGTAVAAISSSAVAVQLAFLQAYGEALARLQQLSDAYLPADVALEKSAAFTLAERIVQGEMLAFDGLPLRGLQIMGVLEARSLDFDTIIIPSMNERVFPRARFTSSFIPPVLRRAFGLTTPDEQENAFTYRFYRMISRAGQVYLLYDARSTGRRTQASRFIHQLRHIYRPASMRRSTFAYSLRNPVRPEFTVAKTPEIMERINRYRSVGPDATWLSASAIKLYLSCPMSFYLSYIAGFSREDKPTEWIDESTFGTIVHDVLENLYASILGHAGNGVLITADTIEAMLRPTNTLIARLTTKAINRHYLNLPDDHLDFALSGQNRLVAKIVEQYVANTLRRDRDLTPFTYLHGEWGADSNGPLTLTGSTGDSTTFNFTCRIDRIDRVTDANGTPRLRIVDYKTGTDSPEATTLEAAVTGHDSVALLQLMLYAQAYAARTDHDGPIQPLIYPLRQMMLYPIGPYRIGQAPARPQSEDELRIKAPGRSGGKWNIMDYRDYAAEINSLIIPYINELFNPTVPFSCAADDSACRFCRFAAICRREA